MFIFSLFALPVVSCRAYSPRFPLSLPCVRLEHISTSSPKRKACVWWQQGHRLRTIETFGAKFWAHFILLSPQAMEGKNILLFKRLTFLFASLTFSIKFLMYGLHLNQSSVMRALVYLHHEKKCATSCPVRHVCTPCIKPE